MTAASACSGLARSLASRKEGSGVGSFEGVAKRTRRVKSPVKGRYSSVPPNMMNVCRLAVCRTRLPGAEASTIRATTGKASSTKLTLNRLKNRWAMAARQAPMRMGRAAMMGTMQVPMTAPRTTTATWSKRVKTPAVTSAKHRPIIAPEEVSSAVSRAEIPMPRKREGQVSPRM
jgi:hypothetical protein